MYELNWTWGIFDDNTMWYLKVEAVDTDLYAVAYYSMDDQNPKRMHESTDRELLEMIIEVEDTEIFADCRDRKNMHIGLKDSFEEVTVANFM